MAIDSNELLGQALGTCTLQRLVGRGGMGVVYLARQSRPRRTVAVKVLVPGMHIDPKARVEFLARFRREADAIAALDHVNIMPIYEYGEQGELAFLVMPYVTGGTLRTLLEKQRVLSLTETIPIIEQAAAALDCAHAQGIIHRDLKPGNILFHADGRVLLADFGLAKVIRGNEEHDSSSDGLSTLTSAGMIIGTPEYLSPEQSTGQPIGPYTDIYALGIVLYQVLGGRVPFVSSSPITIALKHTLAAPASLLQLNPTLPLEVEAVVMKALAKRPEERYTSAGEFARAFRAAANGTPKHQLGKISDENRATITVQGEQKQASERTTDDIADAPTDERPKISVYEDNSADDDISKVSTNNLHEFVTEETPRIAAFAAPTPLVFEARTSEPSAINVPGSAPSLSQQRQAGQAPLLTPQMQENGPKKARRVGCQLVWMMLAGSILTLVLVVGGFTAYLHSIPGVSTPPNNTTRTTPIAKATNATQQPFTPPTAIISAGGVLYGTALPGPSCDSQGGQWSKLPDANVTCSEKATQLTNSGTGGMAGIFLDKLAKDQTVPNNYVLQVQVTTSSDTHGDFGVFFRSQPGNTANAFAFLLNSTGMWKCNTYTTGTASTILSRAVLGKMDGTFTLNIVVQGNVYYLYINGLLQGHTASGLYTNGNLGLVADSGTSVSFNNLVIYALP